MGFPKCVTYIACWQIRIWPNIVASQQHIPVKQPCCEIGWCSSFTFIFHVFLCVNRFLYILHIFINFPLIFIPSFHNLPTTPLFFTSLARAFKLLISRTTQHFSQQALNSQNAHQFASCFPLLLFNPGPYASMIQEVFSPSLNAPK